MNKIIEFGDWQAEDRVLSLGCGSGWWEVNLMHQKPALELILVDELSAVLNQSDFQETIEYFDKQYGQRLETACQLALCDAAATGLVKGSIDQVWLFNSLHEMEDHVAILAESHRVLRSEGIVIVEEIFAGFPGELHEGCGKALFERHTLFALFEQAGFVFLEETKKDATATYLKFQKEI